MGIVSQRLRDSARGQSCTLRTPWCEYCSETTVLAHLPSPIKGMGNKGDDYHAVFACAPCHEAMDQRKPGVEWPRLQLDALQRTQRVWLEMGLLKVPVAIMRPKPSSKIMPRRALAFEGD
jgi:hypothetical protein